MPWQQGWKAKADHSLFIPMAGLAFKTTRLPSQIGGRLLKMESDSLEADPAALFLCLVSLNINLNKVAFLPEPTHWEGARNLLKASTLISAFGGDVGPVGWATENCHTLQDQPVPGP